MGIAVTGATDHLGRLVIDAPLERGVPAGQVVAVVRDTGKAGDLAARGVQVRRGEAVPGDRGGRPGAPMPRGRAMSILAGMVSVRSCRASALAR